MRINDLFVWQWGPSQWIAAVVGAAISYAVYRAVK